MNDTPNIEDDCFRLPGPGALFRAQRITHPPRILLLYGSLRAESYSRKMVREAARSGAAPPRDSTRSIKRQTSKVRVFPNIDSLERRSTSVLVEIGEKRQQLNG